MFTLRATESRSRSLLLVCSSVFAISAFLLLVSSFQLLIGWRDSTTPEGSIAYSISAVTSSAEVYRDFREPPYATTAYGPGYYAATGVLAKALGGGIRNSYLAGRCTSLACFLGVLAVIYCSVFRSAGWLGGFACTMSLCTVTFLDGWIATARPDVVAAFLSLFGIHFISSPTRRSVILASALFSAALLVKQSFIAGPISAAFWLALHSQKKEACVLCVCAGALTAGGYLLAWLVWGDLLLQNIVTANQAPLSLNLPIVLQTWAFKCGYLPFVMSAVGVASYWGRKKGQPVEVLYLLASLFLAGAASAKAGAYINYFLEPVFAATLVSARGWRHVLCWIKLRDFGRLPAALTLLALVQPALLLRAYSTLSNGAIPPTPPSELITWAKGFGSPLIGSPDLALQLYRTPHILDLFNASYLSDQGKVQFESLLDKIDSGEISTIITDTRMDTEYSGTHLWPKPLRDIVSKQFELAPEQEFGYYVYKKRGYDG